MLLSMFITFLLARKLRGKICFVLIAVAVALISLFSITVVYLYPLKTFLLRPNFPLPLSFPFNTRVETIYLWNASKTIDRYEIYFLGSKIQELQYSENINSKVYINYEWFLSVYSIFLIINLMGAIIGYWIGKSRLIDKCFSRIMRVRTESKKAALEKKILLVSVILVFVSFALFCAASYYQERVEHYKYIQKWVLSLIRASASHGGAVGGVPDLGFEFEESMKTIVPLLIGSGVVCLFSSFGLCLSLWFIGKKQGLKKKIVTGFLLGFILGALLVYSLPFVLRKQTIYDKLRDAEISYGKMGWNEYTLRYQTDYAQEVKSWEFWRQCFEDKNETLEPPDSIHVFVDSSWDVVWTEVWTKNQPSKIAYLCFYFYSEPD